MRSLRIKLLLLALLSSLWSARAEAHEVVPVIADLVVQDGEMRLDLRMNLEVFVAGIDLGSVLDTSTAEEAARYDALRAMEPAALEAEARDWAGGWLPGVRVSADGAPLATRLAEVVIPEVGDLSFARNSHLVIAAEVPEGTRVLEVAWPEGAGQLVLRQQGVEKPYTGLIEAGGTSGPIEIGGGGMKGALSAFAGYVPVGFDHILPKGLDHILFVLGLFFLSTRLRPLLWQVSAFTLAHTITLALGALGWVSVPAGIVEPLIAASITYVAVENVLTNALHAWRPAVVFCFGLLHGLGFASVLEEFGLPEGQFVPALLGFNVGVELGQITVIAMAFLAVGYWFGGKPWYRRAIAVPASLAIAAVGAYWFVERAFF